MEMVNTARRAQVAFTEGIEQWSLALLSGKNDGLAMQHVGLFRQSRQEVLDDLHALQALMARHNLTATMADDMILQINPLFDRYERALTQATDGSEGAVFAAAGAVRGMERNPSQALDSLVEYVTVSAKDFQERANSAAAAFSKRLLWILGGVGVAGILLAAIIGFLIMLRITREVRALERALEEISTGEADLTSRLTVSGRDEVAAVAEHFNRFVERLAVIVRNLKDSAEHGSGIREELTRAASEAHSSVVEIGANISSINDQMQRFEGQAGSTTTAMDEITASIHNLTNQAEEQASAVTQSSASVEQMIASINNVAEITAQRKTAVVRLLEIAQESGEQMQETANAFHALTGNIDRIQEMVGIIDEISSQTNLLSMNAAIEAAHAGEAGKGFAVVADEIGKLAAMTRENSEGIADLIQEIVETIQTTGTSVNATGESFDEINREIHQVANSIEEINSSTYELSAGGAQILKAMTALNEISNVVNENSGHMDEEATSVRDAMKTLSLISNEVLSGMQEIESGTQLMTETAQHVAALAEQLAAVNATIQSEVYRFRTDERADSEAYRVTIAASAFEPAGEDALLEHTEAAGRENESDPATRK